MPYLPPRILVPRILIIFMAVVASLPGPARAEDSSDGFTGLLTIGSVGRSGRSLSRTDAIEAAIVRGTFTPPVAGEEISLADGGVETWQPGDLTPEGTFEGRIQRGGYAALTIEREQPTIAFLEASGHAYAYLNGVPHMGDPYSMGTVRIPVLLEAGQNTLLLLGSGRGQISARLTPVEVPVSVDTVDTTLPDLLAGSDETPWAGLMIRNATGQTRENLWIEARRDGHDSLRTPVPAMPPLSVQKAPVRLPATPELMPETESVIVQVDLGTGNGADETTLQSIEITLRVRDPVAPRKRTFLSEIDGSVQYFGLRLAQPAPGSVGPPALILTLHGASVEGVGQAEAYGSKSWAHIVAPTNRRPFGFDWEDWGRMDALEVLRIAQRELANDPRRVYLTGHSMGGHGSWHLASTFPDQFAAVAPSAGWISFNTYGRRGGATPEPPLLALANRAGNGSDTTLLINNLASLGVYILHGDADDNVPVSEARAMRELLAPFHKDLSWHEQPDAGHWWDVSDEPGADCVDWPPLFDFLARHTRPGNDAVRSIDFTTVNPGVSSRSHWAVIEAQTEPLLASRIQLKCDPLSRRFAGTTENVARLSLLLDHLSPADSLRVILDGQKAIEIPWPEGTPRIWLERTSDGWVASSPPDPSLKGPTRSGPFKEAFQNKVLLVYGTKGTPEENAWAVARARLDAESFLYRGNGKLDMLPDTAFDPGASRDRNVILYGHADMHEDWPALLGDSPVQVARDRVRAGEVTREGEDLAALFVRPRPGSDSSLVGVISGTGLTGLRLTDRLPYFVSGVGLPDLLVFDPRFLESADAGIEAAGYFGVDWTIPKGHFSWNLDRTEAD